MITDEAGTINSAQP